ncbi:MAG: homoaconitase [Ignavibacteriales bacterium]|nr:homoaconitase [Ignavibacteriales bacterium]MCF8314749.1 homoaconitase [Ignavibacteriales bacterium]MCF8438003.1 homoaconitase [Ignavibacteriales bacterium]
MPQNFVEKICQKHVHNNSGNKLVQSGDYISIAPSYVMTHDNTGAVIPKFKSIGAVKLFNPRQVVNTLDHNIQDKSEKNLEKYKKIENFARSMGADFYPAGRGIGHQIMIEEGYAWPGTMVVASDSHSNMYGGIGCLGTPIVRTDAASIWATGRTWWQIPLVIKVNLNGRLKAGVRGKDVIIALCGYFKKDEVLNSIVEFSGDGISELNIDQRLTIANMTTEWGALGGIFMIDDVTINWLEKRIDYIEKRGLPGVSSDPAEGNTNPRLNRSNLAALKQSLNALTPDKDAFYSKILNLDLLTIEPFISGPNTVKTMHKVSEVSRKKININKAYLVSCVNSRIDDIAEAAEAISGKKVAEGVNFYISAASNEVQKESEMRGDWQKLINAGAIPLPPGCGPCIGLGTGLLEDGEVGISATNRNFKGRMGSREADAYLASPAVVAASAVAGYITAPFTIEPSDIIGTIEELQVEDKDIPAIDIIPGFKEEITGNLVFCHQDNLNTDGIYPGKYTYNDDFTPEDQARVVMENYDPEFVGRTNAGDILAGGFNFGTGSSREQAATALKYKGIQCVIVGSASQTYMRNALNNGFLVVESPSFIKYLKSFISLDKPTIYTENEIRINFKTSKIYYDEKVFNISPVGPAAQELVVLGGLENWIKNNIKN